MSTDAPIERALAAVTAGVNDQGLERFDTRRVQAIVTEAFGGEQRLTVDDGGGLHDESGDRIGAIRRTDSGEWIAERQNPSADRSEAPVPSPPPQGALHRVLKKIRVAIS